MIIRSAPAALAAVGTRMGVPATAHAEAHTWIRETYRP